MNTPSGKTELSSEIAAIQSLLIMPDAIVRDISRTADVRDYDAPGGGTLISKVQRRIRFIFFKYLTAPFFRSTWQRQVEFNRRTALLAQALSAMEVRVRQLEEKLSRSVDPPR